MYIFNVNSEYFNKRSDLRSVRKHCEKNFYAVFSQCAGWIKHVETTEPDKRLIPYKISCT